MKYQFRTNFDFCFLPYFYQNWVNGLDLDRFCAPEHICELWFLSIFWDFDFFGESVCWILAFGSVNKAYGCIRVHMDAYGCIRMHIGSKSVHLVAHSPNSPNEIRHAFLKSDRSCKNWQYSSIFDNICQCTYLPTIRYCVLYGTAYLPTRTVRYRNY